jgi:DNA-binding NarL/FixJ family response regulator
MKNKKYRTIIADDHHLLTEGLKMLIGEWDEFDVVKTCANGRETCEACAALSPDLVIMDMSMPEMDGASAIQKIKKQNKKIKILALTTFDDSATVKNAITAGCDGFLLKAVEPEILKNSLLSMMNGIDVFDENAAGQLRDMAGRRETPQFSERDREMLRMIREGKTNHEIAEKLGLRTGTVKNLITFLLSKTNSVSRSGLAAYAVEHRII